MTYTSRALVGTAAAAALALTGCSTARQADGDEPLRVVAAFYPLEYVVAEVGGDDVSVTGLTDPGAEPHDLELTPGRLRDLARADVVVYLAGFQAAVDDAVGQLDHTDTVEVSDAAGQDEHGEEDEHGDSDAHFWLDPTRLADVGDEVATRLGETDPARAERFTARAAALRSQLTALDESFAAGLRDCTLRTVVSSHEAFGYLAARYGLDHVGIAGVSPEQEPTSADLAAITRLVRSEGVRTVFTEPLVPPAVADTVAEAAGVRTALLDPVEGLTDASPGSDYLEVMRANLRSLREGLGCR